MFTHYRSRAFILKKINRGEADCLFTIFSEEFGRIELLARSIRKIKSKLRAGAELFYLSEIEFIQGKNYKTLTDAILIDNFKNLRKNLLALSSAYKISEVFDSLVKGEEPDRKIWQLLVEIFEKSNSQGLKPITYRLIYYYFLWNLFSVLGYQLELYYCSICQKKLKQEKIFLNLKEQGLVCRQCQNKIKFKKIIVLPEAIKIIRIFLKKDWSTFERLKISSESFDSLRLTSDYYLAGILSSSQ